jgi:hypothetical protein
MYTFPERESPAPTLTVVAPDGSAGVSKVVAVHADAPANGAPVVQRRHVPPASR